MMYIIISLSYINAILKNNDKKILIIFYLVIISLLNIDLSLGTHFIIFSGIWSIEICYLVVYMFLIILPIVIRLKGRKKSDKSYKCE